MYLAIIILPLLGSLVSGLFGRKIGVSGAQLITCLSIVITTILAIVAFFEVGLNNIPLFINLFRWVDSESLNVLWSFQFDSITVSMLIPVLIVSSLVHIYSIGYMSHDPHQQRFFSYLSLFTFMMIILVTANNYLLMFVGWEGVGVCSYLLVSFWFTRIAANQSSIAAFLTNRVGDCFLTIGMFAILWSFGNVDYSTVFSLAPFVNENIVTIIGICLLIGAMAKSSQVGLHVWLPMAMEGPTPVSALIHAATMVTAGVYLLIRSSPLIEYSSTALLLCLWLGAITTVFSSLIGLFQQDIKKVIAYSTMSQLGMMVIAVGLSSYNLALFHLVNHAFYKALLFLGAGSVIHAVADNQDFRKYGGLRSYLPLTYSVMLIASLSLVAFPFMTGFYSKDFILESAYGGFTYTGVVVYYIATIGAIFTTLYSVKVLYLTFLANPNGSLNNFVKRGLWQGREYIHKFQQPKILRNRVLNLEGEIYMNIPLILLAIFSIFFGFITKEIFIGLGSDFFSYSLFIHSNHEKMLDTEFAVSTIIKLLPFVFTLFFSIFAIFISEYSHYLVYFKLSRIGYNISTFLNQRFFIELLYNKYISGLIFFKLGKQTSIVLDKGSVELLGPYGLERGLIVLSKDIHKLSTGIITNYALYILMGLIFYMSLPLLIKYQTILFILCIIGLLGLIDNKSDEYNSHLALPVKTSGFLYFNKINILKHFTYKNVLLGLFMLILAFSFRFCFLPFILYLFKISLSEMIQWSLTAIISLFFKLSIKGVIEALIEALFLHYDISPDKQIIGGNDDLKSTNLLKVNPHQGSSYPGYNGGNFPTRPGREPTNLNINALIPGNQENQDEADNQENQAEPDNQENQAEPDNQENQAEPGFRNTNEYDYDSDSSRPDNSNVVPYRDMDAYIREKKTEIRALAHDISGCEEENEQLQKEIDEGEVSTLNHQRRINANKQDIDHLETDMRTCKDELRVVRHRLNEVKRSGEVIGCSDTEDTNSYCSEEGDSSDNEEENSDNNRQENPNNNNNNEQENSNNNG